MKPSALAPVTKFSLEKKAYSMEPLLRRASEPPHLKEVDAIWYGKKKFHSFDEERLKSFA